MPEQLPQPPKEIIELCGVVAVEQQAGEHGTQLNVTTLALGTGPVQLTVGEGQMAVLRYADAEYAPHPGGDVYVEDGTERVEIIGASEQDLPDEYFRLPGRRGGLRALDQRRIAAEALYTAAETAGLEKLLKAESGQRPARPLRRRGQLPGPGAQLARRQAATRRGETFGIIVQRQQMVVARLAALASVDVVRGTIDPVTARRRALMRPEETDEHPAESPTRRAS